MRVLFLNPYLPPPLGGIEKELFAIAEEFRKLGHDSTVLSTNARFPAGTNDAPEVPDGILAERLRGFVRSTARGFAPARPPLVVPGLAARARELAPDLVMVFNVGWGPVLRPALAALRSGARPPPILYRTYFHPPGGWLRDLKTRYILHTVARADRALIATAGEAEELVGSGHLEPSKVAIVPPGVHVHPDDQSAVEGQRRRFDLAGQTVIAHVARLSTFKGTEDLIRVLPGVRSRTGQDVTLMLIGADNSGGELARLAAELGVVEHVRFAGEIRDDRELRQILAACDLFALPSEYEAFGIAYIEALAEGLPCVGCDVGGVRAAIGTDGTILERFGDRPALTEALVALVSDPARRRALGAAGRARVLATLTWGHTAERVMSIADEVRRERGTHPERA